MLPERVCLRVSVSMVRERVCLRVSVSMVRERVSLRVLVSMVPERVCLRVSVSMVLECLRVSVSMVREVAETSSRTTMFMRRGTVTSSRSLPSTPVLTRDLDDLSTSSAFCPRYSGNPGQLSLAIPYW